MIELFVLSVFFIVSFSALLNLPLGYSLAVASFFVIPESARVALGPVSTNFHSLLAFTLIAMFIVKKTSDIIMSGYKTKIVSVRFLSPLLVFLLASFILLLISAIVSRVPLYYQISRLKSELLSIVFGFLSFFVIRNSSDRKVFFNAFLISVLFVSLYGIFTYVVKLNPYLQLFSLTFDGDEYGFAVKFIEEVRGFIEGRIQSTFRHPLTLGQVAALSLSFFLLYKRKRSLFVTFLFVVLLLSMVVLSGSRAAILSVVVFVYFAYFHYKPITSKIVYVLVSFVIILGFTAASLESKNGFILFFKSTIIFWDKDLQREANISGSSGDLRERQFEAAVNEVDEGSWLVGKGRGYRGYLQNEIGSHSVLRGFESVVLLKLVEEGLLGLLFFFLLGFQLYHAGKIRIRTEGDSDYFLPGYNAFFLSYLSGIVFTGVRTPSLLLFLSFYMLLIKSRR